MEQAFSLTCNDAVAWLYHRPSESVDLLITDPAYESIEKHRKRGTTTRLTHSKGSSNDWFKVFPNDRLAGLMLECYRVLKSNNHLYVFCDQETMFLIKPLGEKVGFKFWKPLVWDKGKIGMGYHYRARYELILFFEKGKRKLNDLSIPDVLAYDRIFGGYPTEKPVDLLKVLVRQSSTEGDLVADPFCGSGSTAVAAIELGRKFAGCDLSQDAISISTTRAKAASQKAQ